MRCHSAAKRLRRHASIFDIGYEPRSLRVQPANRL